MTRARRTHVKTDADGGEHADERVIPGESEHLQWVKERETRCAVNCFFDSCEYFVEERRRDSGEHDEQDACHENEINQVPESLHSFQERGRSLFKGPLVTAGCLSAKRELGGQSGKSPYAHERAFTEVVIG